MESVLIRLQKEICGGRNKEVEKVGTLNIHPLNRCTSSSTCLEPTVRPIRRANRDLWEEVRDILSISGDIF
jgi:hypothetical protein